MSARTVRGLTAVLVAGALLAGCGTRRSHEELLDAAATVAAPGPAGATGGTDGLGATGDLGATVTTAPAGAGTAGGDTIGTTGASTTGTAGTGGPAAPGGGTTAGTPASTPRGGDPITIGVVGTLSGPAGASLGSLAEGVQVWSRWINARGGLDGHQVKVVVADDSGDPSRHRALVQEFVEQRGVIAFVGNPEALTGAGSVQYLTGAGIPVIGSDGAGDWFYSSPTYFPQGPSGQSLLDSNAPLLAAEAVPKGLLKVGTISCVEVQVCRDGHNQARAGFAKVGMQVVYQAQASLGQPDFTAQCIAARDAGAQLLLVAMDANAVRAIALACARQRYRPTFAFSSGQVTANMAADPNLEGTFITANVAPWPSTASPSTRQFQEAMATYAPGRPVAGGHMQGWVSAKVLELAATGLPTKVAAADLLQRLGRINGDVLPELAGPLRYRPGAPAQRSICAFGVRIKGGNFVAADDLGRVCAG